MSESSSLAWLVRELMTPVPARSRAAANGRSAIHPDESLSVCIERFVELGVTELDVRDGGEVEGVIRLREIVRACAEALAEADRAFAFRDDAAMELAAHHRLATTICHEVKNAITGARGAMGIIAEALDIASPDHAIIARILARLDGASALLDDLCHFTDPDPARLETGRLGALLQTIAVAHGGVVAVEAADDGVTLIVRLAATRE